MKKLMLEISNISDTTSGSELAQALRRAARDIEDYSAEDLDGRSSTISDRAGFIEYAIHTDEST